MFSPDGRWIAYQSDESRAYQVYVQAFPDGHGKRQISGETGVNPAWSHDGQELFFGRFAPRAISLWSPPIRCWEIRSLRTSLACGLKKDRQPSLARGAMIGHRTANVSWR